MRTIRFAVTFPATDLVARCASRVSADPLRIDASINVVGQVSNLSGQDEILSYDATLISAPVLNPSPPAGPSSRYASARSNKVLSSE